VIAPTTNFVRYELPRYVGAPDGSTRRPGRVDGAAPELSRSLSTDRTETR